MERSLDAIVVGLGAMGAATVFQLARRGRAVLGIDRHHPPHALGSSHGETRVTRLAIGEGEQYTPLAIRSHEIWREIERETGERLLVECGGLVISGSAAHANCHGPGFFANTIAAAKRHGISHELLDAPAIRRRFPAFAVRDDEVGYYEPSAGYVRPEACVETQLALARGRGAILGTGETVLEVGESAGSAFVRTDRGTYRAGRVVITAGPWLPELLGPVWAGRFTVRRQVLHWFEPRRAADFAPGRFPVFIWEIAGHAEPIYGFPEVPGHAGVKIATEQLDTATTAQAVARQVDPAEARDFFAAKVAGNLPGLTGRCLASVACLYTMTADFDFVIEPHPHFPRVLVASPCSGHGFKHSAAIGESIAARLSG
jgi:sarcosine oxidase